MSFRQIGQLTGTNSETTRRYLTSGRPSIEFVIALCRAMNVSADWLLLGTHESQDRVQARSLAQVLELIRLASGTAQNSSSDQSVWLHVVDGPLAGQAIRGVWCPHDRVELWVNAMTGMAIPADRVERLRHPWVLVAYRREGSVVAIDTSPTLRVTSQERAVPLHQDAVPTITLRTRAAAP